jgi:acetolactate synthase regulatory subunit
MKKIFVSIGILAIILTLSQTVYAAPVFSRGKRDQAPVSLEKMKERVLRFIDHRMGKFSSSGHDGMRMENQNSRGSKNSKVVLDTTDSESIDDLKEKIESATDVKTLRGYIRELRLLGRAGGGR